MTIFCITETDKTEILWLEFMIALNDFIYP